MQLLKLNNSNNSSRPNSTMTACFHSSITSSMQIDITATNIVPAGPITFTVVTILPSTLHNLPTVLLK